MKPYQQLYKEQEPEENASIAKNMSMAQSYLLKAARAQGMNPSRALYAIDDLFLLFNVIMNKKSYDRSMSNAVNKVINILRKKWGVE